MIIRIAFFDEKERCDSLIAMDAVLGLAGKSPICKNLLASDLI